ncbi:hypothetical protein BU17DRAFT_72132 [Hysterangium stoloniferum]|nr:hypothetical protein BU17DRAFT_72132 [Hysterangium stoloniferum]
MPKQSVPSTFGGKRVAAKETVHDEGDATQCEDDDDERRFRRFRGVRVWRGATWRTGEVLTESIEYSVVIHWLAVMSPRNHRIISNSPKTLLSVLHSCPSCSATPPIAKNDEFVAIYMLSGIWEKPSIVCTMVEMSANLRLGVGLREYGPLLLDGSLFMDHSPSAFGQGPNAGMLHPHIVPKANTTFHPKSQTPGHDIVDVDDGNDKGANEDQDYTPCISWEERGKGLRLGEYGPLMLDGLLLTGSFTKSFSGYTSETMGCRGFATCLERPQGLLDSSGIGQGMSNIEREAMTRWFARVIRNPTDVEVGPGYFCGLKMERIGTKLLYGTKLSILVVKCFFNTRHVEEHQWRVVRLTDTGEGEKARNRLLEKHLTVGQLSILVKEGGSLEACSLLKAVLPALGTSEEGNIGRVIVVMAHVIDLMVFIEDSPAKMVPRNFPVTAMLSPRYVYHTLVDTSKHP